MALGPVHYQMYEKIKLENELIKDIQDCAAEEGWQLTRQYDEQYAPLDQVIDMNNVHNWIQSHMEDVERRLADIVEELSEGHAERLNQLKETAYLTGYRHSVQAPDAKSAYEVINAAVLNGMPCDDVIEIIQNDADKVVWREKTDMHASYWQNPSVYRQLRNEMIRGLLAKSGLQYTAEEGNYSISGSVQSL